MTMRFDVPRPTGTIDLPNILVISTLHGQLFELLARKTSQIYREIRKILEGIP